MKFKKNLPLSPGTYDIADATVAVCRLQQLRTEQNHWTPMHWRAFKTHSGTLKAFLPGWINMRFKQLKQTTVPHLALVSICSKMIGSKLAGTQNERYHCISLVDCPYTHIWIFWTDFGHNASSSHCEGRGTHTDNAHYMVIRRARRMIEPEVIYLRNS